MKTVTANADHRVDAGQDGSARRPTTPWVSHQLQLHGDQQRQRAPGRPVTVADDKATVTCPDVTTVGNLDGDLDPMRASPVRPATTITQADINAGSVTNTATASAGGTDSNQDDETVTANQNPALSVDKVLTDNADEDTSGTISLNDTLTYQITASNDGNVTLNNVSVSDDLTGDSTSCLTVAPGSTCV